MGFLALLFIHSFFSKLFTYILTTLFRYLIIREYSNEFLYGEFR